ncbi:phosphatase domain-containing protein [Yoonia litorea]|uniref:Phosphatidate phosphatase APP1 n=1 Tax=Yoonia litorea TaxID=1123755 RepID=A0A1I6N008_9RHOB|nr:phosphatase domain-containing protein [Yoonia litorea]SFS21279.1 Phosphatidate phosphatase APP1 [Yoonia litorea]
MNAFERTIVKIGSKLEYQFAKFMSKRRKPRVIEPYIGYATPDELVVKGRVLASRRYVEERFGQSRVRNVGQMLGRFMTAEVAGAQVQAEGISTTSDEEGYFELRLPRNGRHGWVTVETHLHDQDNNLLHSEDCAVLAPVDSKTVIISDIDDTVMKTGAYSLTRNLWTSFTGNTLTRQVFADSAVLLDRLTTRRSMPVYYVSSSPWNLHDFLQTIFDRSAVVKGPMFLRDLGLSETKLITNGHGDHKGAAIDTILDANPDGQAILIGDLGQKDAQVYHDAIIRHEGRIAAVILRDPGPQLDAKIRKALKKLEDTGVPTFHDTTFAGLDAKILDLIPTEK